MSFTIDVRGVPQIRKALAKWMQPSVGRRLQAATKAGASEFKSPMKREAATVSSRLARSVSARQARRDRPASVVSFRPKVAFFRHWIIGGTKDHGPRKLPYLFFIPNWNPYMRSGPPSGASQVRTRRVRGVKPNPIPRRVFDSTRSEAERAIVDSLTKDIP